MGPWNDCARHRRRQQELTSRWRGSVFVFFFFFFLGMPASRLEQSIGNLLIQASKYKQPGGHSGLVTSQTNSTIIECGRRQSGQMTPEFHTRTSFDYSPAEQIVGSQRRRLGHRAWPLVKSLVELHRGTVTVHRKAIARGKRVT